MADSARPSPTRREPARLAALAVVAAGAAATLVLNWPGHFSYDSVVQLAEGRAGVYSGEHPPVMSWLLGLADALWPGAKPFVVLQVLLIEGAFAALVLVAPRVSWLAPPLAAVLQCSPQLAIYPAIVWKDVLFAGASAAGFAALACSAAGRPSTRPRYAALAAGLTLLTLAALTRQNGVLVLPFAALAVGWIAGSADGRARSGLVHGAGFLAASAVLLVAGSAALATRLETDDGTAEAWTALQTYDIAGAAARDPALDLSVLRSRDPALAAAVRSVGVPAYRPDRIHSIELLLDRMAADGADAGPVADQWRGLILSRPLLYLRVRAAAFRWVLTTPAPRRCVLVYTGVAGPAEEMAGARLAPRKAGLDRALADYAFAFGGTPAMSHGAMAAIGMVLLAVLLLRRRPPDVAVAAMLGAALAFAASFAVISIACDYRYLYDLDIAVLAAAVYLAADASRAVSGASDDAGRSASARLSGGSTKGTRRALRTG